MRGRRRIGGYSGVLRFSHITRRRAIWIHAAAPPRRMIPVALLDDHLPDHAAMQVAEVAVDARRIEGVLVRLAGEEVVRGPAVVARDDVVLDRRVLLVVDPDDSGTRRDGDARRPEVVLL